MATQRRFFAFFVIVTVAAICIYSCRTFLWTNRSHIESLAISASCIIESNAIHDVLSYATDDSTVVVFDIDNTLICPTGDVGSDQWFSYLMKEKMAQGMTFDQALPEVLPLHFKMQDFITMRPVESNTASIVNVLQQKNIPTLALTSRSLQLEHRTYEHLKSVPISFMASPCFRGPLTLSKEKPAMLNNGIIFCGNNNKGTILMQTLRACNCCPKTVLFVDDKLKCLLEVEKECLENKIRFIGIRYGKLDKIVSGFDQKRAQCELEQLLKLMPDTTTFVAAT